MKSIEQIKIDAEKTYFKLYGKELTESCPDYWAHMYGCLEAEYFILMRKVEFELKFNNKEFIEDFFTK